MRRQKRFLIAIALVTVIVVAALIAHRLIFYDLDASERETSRSAERLISICQNEVDLGAMSIGPHARIATESIVIKCMANPVVRDELLADFFWRLRDRDRDGLYEFVDGWGTEFAVTYDTEKKKITIISAGPDGMFGYGYLEPGSISDLSSIDNMVFSSYPASDGARR